jgi:hypothetical protein
MPPRIPIVSPRAVIALPSRSVGLTLITQAITGANIAKKAIDIDAIADGIAILFALNRRQASSLGLRLTRPMSWDLTDCILGTVVT